jgi:hypothetical protein
LDQFRKKTFKRGINKKSPADSIDKRERVVLLKKEK